MPSVRFARDKRGYEYVYLVHAPTRKGKPGKSRVLYWYRTPPGVRIGRKPFDEEVRRTLEAQNPGLTFDWEAIIATPMPPPDMTEYWRERRRLEKAAKLERMAEEAREAAVSAPSGEPAPQDARESQEPEEADELTASETSAEEADARTASSGDVNLADIEGDEQTSSADGEDEGEDAEPGVAAAGGPETAETRRKRRRRGGRRRRGAQRAGQAAPDQPDSMAPAEGAPGSIEPAPHSDDVRGEAASNPDRAPESQIASSAEPQTSTSEE